MPWRAQDQRDREEYQGDPNNLSDAQNEVRFQEVIEKLTKDIESGRVVVHRKFSGEAVQSFEDESLDWIYLDGSHVYEDVLADLDSYDAKIKKDGFILGHDYTNHAEAKKMNFGVVEAVDEFVARSGYEFLVLTNAEFPTFVLAKTVNSEAVQTVLADIVFNVRGTIEIHDFPRRGFKHKEVMSKGRIVNLIPSF